MGLREPLNITHRQNKFFFSIFWSTLGQTDFRVKHQYKNVRDVASLIIINEFETYIQDPILFEIESVSSPVLLDQLLQDECFDVGKNSDRKKIDRFVK